jgi:SAM-dependent methyltransferase
VKKQLPPEARTSLRHVGGETRLTGDEALARTLAIAFEVSPEDEEAARAHVHGFHSYPARLHPTTAARLLGELLPKGGTLLDPFCGSGTVLVEGRLLGARAIGTDVNPLALRLARLKARGVPKVERDALVTAARRVKDHADRRRVEKARPTIRYGEEDVALFEPHVLLELDSLRDGIDAIPSRALREDVELVLSAILTKVSRKRGDTGQAAGARRISAGFAAKIFLAKAEELARSLADFEANLPAGAPPVDVHADDARTLGTIGAATVDLVLTSPPYAATYDYVSHHDLRLRWLRLKTDRFEKLELGSRRAYARLRGDEAARRWNDELGRTVQAIGRALRPSGLAVLVIADSAVERTALRATDITEKVAREVGLVVEAVASQARPHFHSRTKAAFDAQPREEHLIALRRPAT